MAGMYKAIDLNLAEKIRNIVLLAAEPARTLENIAVGNPTSIAKLSHYEEQKTLYYSTILSAFADAATLGPITVSADFAKVLFTNQLILVEEEAMIIDTVDKTANTFTVKARGHGSSTAVAHAIGASVRVLAIAEPEGVVTNSYIMGDRIERTNYFQEVTTDVKLTYRAIEQALKDRDLRPDEARNVLWLEEQVRQMRKHIQQLDNVLMDGYMAYDATDGQHTVGGYKEMILTRGGISQTTLGYANGAFDYDDWTSMLHELENRGSNVNIIKTNTATKSKIIAFHDKTLYRRDLVTPGQGNIAGDYYDGVVAAEWDGRPLMFLIDNKIKNSEFHLLNFDNMQVVPRKNYEGGSKMFNMAEEKEDTNTAMIRTVLRSEMSLELGKGEEMVVCKNV